MNNTGLRSTIRGHAVALILFPLLSLAWVGDTLFTSTDLSAFDIIYRLSHWKEAHEYRGVQQIILSDSPQAHYPERALKWRAARNGERVDFNPYIYTGMPELSQGAGGFVTSPFQLFMDVSEAIDWSSWFRLAAAGLLMYAFLITLNLTPLAAVLGGVLWTFNLHQMVWLEFPQHLATQLWIPPLLCFNYLTLRRGLSWENVFGILITNTLFFTSDYIQIVLYTYVAIGLFNTVYLLADSSLSARQRLLRWTSVHAVFVLSAVVLIPKLIVELQFLDSGLRGGQEWRSNMPDLNWSLAPLLLTLKNILPDIADYKRFFAPNYYGGLWGQRYAGGEFFSNVVVGSTYTGVVIFLLAPFSLVWLRDRERRPFILATVVVLLFAFGMIHEDPFLLNAFTLIPNAQLGGYVRYITIIVLLISVVCAVGLHAAMRMAPRRSQWLFWVVLLVAITSPLWIQVADPSVTLHKMRYPLIFLGVLGASAAVLGYIGQWRRLPVLILAVAIVDLWIVTYGFNPRMQDHRNFSTTPTLELLIHDQEPYRVAEVSTRQLYPPNILQYYGIPSINGYSTVAPEPYLDLFDDILDVDYHVTGNGQFFLFEPSLEMFRLLNVKYVLSESRLPDERLKLVREAPGYWVYEMRDFLPRAFCADTLVSFESRSELEARFGELIRQYDRPVALVGSESGSEPLTPNCRVTNVETHLDGATFGVTSDEASYVFVPYNHYPHWRAQSDGADIPVFRANYTFIALPIQAGTHHVRLYYRDPMNTVFNIVMIALGLVIITWSLCRRQRTGTSWALGFAALVLVLWSLLEIPGIGNSDLPERPNPSTVLPPPPPA